MPPKRTKSVADIQLHNAYLQLQRNKLHEKLKICERDRADNQTCGDRLNHIRAQFERWQERVAFEINSRDADIDRCRTEVIHGLEALAALPGRLQEPWRSSVDEKYSQALHESSAALTMMDAKLPDELIVKIFRYLVKLQYLSTDVAMMSSIKNTAENMLSGHRNAKLLKILEQEYLKRSRFAIRSQGGVMVNIVVISDYGTQIQHLSLDFDALLRRTEGDFDEKWRARSRTVDLLRKMLPNLKTIGAVASIDKWYCKEQRTHPGPWFETMGSANLSNRILTTLNILRQAELADDLILRFYSDFEYERYSLTITDVMARLHKEAMVTIRYAGVLEGRPQSSSVAGPDLRYDMIASQAERMVKDMIRQDLNSFSHERELVSAGESRWLS